MTKKIKAATFAGAAQEHINIEPDFIVKKAAEQSYRELRQELVTAGIKVNSTESDSQLQRLGAVLEYLGTRGLNTYEAEVAGGFARIATRIHDLRQAGWEILSKRETAVGPDGLSHINVARYFLIRRPDAAANSDGAARPLRAYRRIATPWDRFNAFRSDWLAEHPGASAAQFDAALAAHISHH